MFQMVALSVSISMDALGIGVSYAAKRIEISWSARVIVGAISAIAMFLSIELGAMLTELFSPKWMNLVGVAILFLIGAGFIRGSLMQTEDNYDFNHSDKIDWYEAVLLGVALSADSISTGIAISAIGMSNLWIPLLVGVLHNVFLWLGQKIIYKNRFLCKFNPRICGLVSGILLFGIGIFRIIFS